MSDVEKLMADSRKRNAKSNESNFDIIRRYVAGDDKTIVLDDLQQQQLIRWNFYINLKTGYLKKSKIIKMMIERFHIERATVYTDIGFAEALFGYSSTLDKRFRISARIDFLEDKIKFLYENDNIENAIKLESVLQKYYSDYPELKRKQSARVIVYSITKNEYYNKVEGDGMVPDENEALEILEQYKTN